MIYVIRVKLDSETSALGMMDGGIPVSTYGVVGRILGYIYQARVILEGQDLIYGTVRGIVIHHYHIEEERSLLRQGGGYRLPYCARPGVAGMTTEASYSNSP